MAIDYQIIRSRNRRKTINLNVNSQGQVVIRAPIHTSPEDIHAFVRQHTDWIRQRLDVHSQKPTSIEFRQGETIRYQGSPAVLNIQSEYDRKRTHVSFNSPILTIKTPLGLRGHQRRQLLRHQIIKWYRRQARQQITRQVEHYTKLLGKSYNQIRLKDTSSRWGSCSSQNNLNFNWKLIMAPPHILNYVVIHEVCHLVHQHHQPSFWKLVANYDPNYKQHRRWLHQYGWQLDI